MNRATASRGIALEFGKLPYIRLFSEPEEASAAPRRRILYAYTSERLGGGRKLLRACQSIREVFRKQESFPISVILLDQRLPEMTGLTLVESIRKAWASDQVVFLCDKEPRRWSATEKTNFDHELASAIELLSQLAPADAADQDPPGDADSERRLQLARERRDQLLRDEKWIDAPAVHVQQGGRPDSQGINNTASRLRRGGELLGAWNGREFLHPTFQFQPDTGRLMPEMKTLLSILPKDRSGWRQALWLFQRHRQLEGQRPADVFQRNPESVIKAARSDFEIDNERW
jgi:CheY-like chemotaxis protein